MQDTNPKNPVQKAVPSDLSDHDERGEELAVEKHWDRNPDDAAAKAGERLEEFEEQGVPLSAEDWEEEEETDDEIPDHLNEAIDESLEQMAEDELDETEEL